MAESEQLEQDASFADDAGLVALVLIARFHNIAADSSQLKHAAWLKSTVFDCRELLLAARWLGLKARKVTVPAERLSRTPLPALALDSNGRRFIVAGCTAHNALVVDPGGSPTPCAPSDAIVRCGGELILFASRASMAGELARFDFSWFIPAVVKYRRLLLEVQFVSALLQVSGPVSLLMFQVVMDKFLVNREFNTLNVVCIVLFVSSLSRGRYLHGAGARQAVLSHVLAQLGAVPAALALIHDRSAWGGHVAD